MRAAPKTRINNFAAELRRRERKHQGLARRRRRLSRLRKAVLTDA